MKKEMPQRHHHHRLVWDDPRAALDALGTPVVHTLQDDWASQRHPLQLVAGVSWWSFLRDCFLELQLRLVSGPASSCGGGGGCWCCPSAALSGKSGPRALVCIAFFRLQIVPRQTAATQNRHSRPQITWLLFRSLMPSQIPRCHCKSP